MSCCNNENIENLGCISKCETAYELPLIPTVTEIVAAKLTSNETFCFELKINDGEPITLDFSAMNISAGNYILSFDYNLESYCYKFKLVLCNTL